MRKVTPFPLNLARPNPNDLKLDGETFKQFTSLLDEGDGAVESAAKPTAAPAPSEVEAATRSGREALKRQIEVHCASLPQDGNRAANVDAGQMEAFLAPFCGFTRALHALQSSAAWLRERGLASEEQALGAFAADYERAVRIYTQMYWDKVNLPGRQAQFMKDANDEAVVNIMAANANMNAVFARHQQAMFDITENLCLICHQPIGLVGGWYHLRCARAHGPVR